MKVLIVFQQFIGETDELWQIHSQKDFKTSKPDEFESWRELYLVSFLGITLLGKYPGRTLLGKCHGENSTW